jgi:drug/metabolite transporter (DMT)-like permease
VVGLEGNNARNLLPQRQVMIKSISKWSRNNRLKSSPISPSILVIFAAVLFGASAPLSKILLGSIDPLPLAALLYLGSGLGSWLLFILRKGFKQIQAEEARLSRPDIPWLLGAILVGGVAAPILLLLGLDRTPASTASLLLNFETVATAIIASLIFKEAIGKRILWAVVLITLASILLTWNGGEWGFFFGALAIIGACFLWGLDNNLTRHISGKDPLMIVGIKGIGAGLFSLMLVFIFEAPMPSFRLVATAMIVGAVCYGVSIQLFILALRGLGSARTGTIFGIAPFIGAALSLIFLGENPQPLFWAAVPVMIFGAFLMLSEDHAHHHLHEPLEHAHAHLHPDEHHHHGHPNLQKEFSGRHTHFHRHEPVKHVHPHAPDLHHRHNHPEPLG